MFALATGEALLMICVAHGGHDLALHVLVAGGALGTVQLLVVQGAVVGAILREEAARRQRFVAFGALEARFVEISVRNTQHLAGAFFLAFAALDLGFTCRGEKAEESNYYRFSEVLRVVVYVFFSRCW